jgi:hypothetical protein
MENVSQSTILKTAIEYLNRDSDTDAADISEYLPASIYALYTIILFGVALNIYLVSKYIKLPANKVSLLYNILYKF